MSAENRYHALLHAQLLMSCLAFLLCLSTWIMSLAIDLVHMSSVIDDRGNILNLHGCEIEEHPEDQDGIFWIIGRSLQEAVPRQTELISPRVVNDANTLWYSSLVVPDVLQRRLNPSCERDVPVQR